MKKMLSILLLGTLVSTQVACANIDQSLKEESDAEYEAKKAQQIKESVSAIQDANYFEWNSNDLWWNKIDKNLCSAFYYKVGAINMSDLLKMPYYALDNKEYIAEDTDIFSETIKKVDFVSEKSSSRFIQDTTLSVDDNIFTATTSLKDIETTLSYEQNSKYRIGNVASRINFDIKTQDLNFSLNGVVTDFDKKDGTQTFKINDVAHISVSKNNFVMVYAPRYYADDYQLRSRAFVIESVSNVDNASLITRYLFEDNITGNYQQRSTWSLYVRDGKVYGKNDSNGGHGEHDWKSCTDNESSVTDEMIEMHTLNNDVLKMPQIGNKSINNLIGYELSDLEELIWKN